MLTLVQICLGTHCPLPVLLLYTSRLSFVATTVRVSRNQGLLPPSVHSEFSGSATFDILIFGIFRHPHALFTLLGPIIIAGAF
ncbi:hypothetical protein F5B21DRAFT_486250 [Xylaria acuta]|nr:hypothetical protein F5B21DRAFT_486250 [Xylaria acuta]